MSGERRRFLPVIVLIALICALAGGVQSGPLHAARLKPVNWMGIAMMAAGVALALGKAPARKLTGVLVCGIGAILVICL